MAAKKWARDLIEKSLPEVEPVEKSIAADSRKDVAQPPAPGPSMSELRRKYLGTARAADAEAADAAEAADSGQDDEIAIVHVRTKSSSSDPADDPGIKSVIASAKKGIIGSQG